MSNSIWSKLWRQGHITMLQIFNFMHIIDTNRWILLCHITNLYLKTNILIDRTKVIFWWVFNFSHTQYLDSLCGHISQNNNINGHIAIVTIILRVEFWPKISVFGPKFSTSGQIRSLYTVLAVYMDFSLMGMEFRMNFWHFGSNFL